MGAFDTLEMRIKDATEFGDIDASCWQTKDLACRQHGYQVVDGKLYVTQNRLTKPFKFLSDFTGVVEIVHSEAKNNASYALYFQEGFLFYIGLSTGEEALEAKYPNNQKDE